jgi:hypothetical protein
MALSAAAIKKALFALALATAGPAGVVAADFEPRRGLNLDIWITWPDETRWDEEAALFPFPEWRRTVGQAQLATLKRDGFDFVRMPVDPSPFLSDRSASFHERLYEEVLEAVRLANSAGLKVIVDLHLFPAGSNRSIGMGQVMADEALFERYVEVVRRMASTLAREDSTLVALELMNEPVVGCERGDEEWPERLIRLFAAARSSATGLTLILTGGCWSSAEGLAAIEPKEFPDDNVLWTFHSYAPFLLTHQGATWAGDFIRHVTGLPYPPHSVPREELDAALEKVRRTIRAEAPWTRRSGMLAYLDEEIAKIDTAEKLDMAMAAPFRIAAEWADRNDIPRRNILLGEFGMIRQEYGNAYVMPGAWRAAYVGDMIALAESKGFSWAIWSHGGAFGVVDAFQGRPAEGDVLEVVRGLPD